VCFLTVRAASKVIGVPAVVRVDIMAGRVCSPCAIAVWWLWGVGNGYVCDPEQQRLCQAT